MLNSQPPFRVLFFSILLVTAPTVAALLVLSFAQELEPAYAAITYIFIVLATLALILPLFGNLSALTSYVNELALDKRVRTPNLNFLSKVVQLPTALERLQKSFEKQRQEMETVITEREILVDTLPDILFMLSNEMKVLRTNRAARMVFGQNLAGKNLREIVMSDHLIASVESVIEDFHGQQSEFYLSEPINRDFQAVIERFPIPSQNGISVILTLNDISSQKRIQRMRADFVANASHEIRTPLASIIGFIETLRGPAKDDAIAREEFLKVMADQAERMSKLVNDLLSLSKIEMNAHNLPTAKVDFLRLVRNEKQHFEWQAQQKGVEMKLNLADNLPATRGDENELAQVVRNLLGNAIKYTNNQSEVILTAKVTTDFPKDPMLRGLPRCILFCVKDQGEGIPKEHIPRLTERFYRVDSARTRKVGGTGLGLAIVKHALSRHQGLLVIDSEVGVGSTFCVYLPVFDDVSKT